VIVFRDPSEVPADFGPSVVAWMPARNLGETGDGQVGERHGRPHDVPDAEVGPGVHDVLPRWVTLTIQNAAQATLAQIERRSVGR